MNKTIIILGTILFLMCGKSQDKIQRYFEIAIDQYPSIQKINWEINYENSYNIQDKHIVIEATGKKGDTTCFVEFGIIPSKVDTFISILDYVTIFAKFDTLYHTKYDTCFIPLYRYKFTKEAPDDLIFEFGEDIYIKDPVF